MEKRRITYQNEDSSDDEYSDEIIMMPSFCSTSKSSWGDVESNQPCKKYASSEEVAKTLEGIEKFMRESEKELKEINNVWKTITPMMEQMKQTVEPEPTGWKTTQDEIDYRSVWVGNVDYSATRAELEAIFEDCGTIKRSTIPTNPITGIAKGFAYIEFEERVSAELALYKHSELLKNREIEVLPKRTNIAGFNASNPSRKAGPTSGTMCKHCGNYL